MHIDKDAWVMVHVQKENTAQSVDSDWLKLTPLAPLTSAYYTRWWQYLIIIVTNLSLWMEVSILQWISKFHYMNLNIPYSPVV